MAYDFVSPDQRHGRTPSHPKGGSAAQYAEVHATPTSDHAQVGSNSKKPKGKTTKAHASPDSSSVQHELDTWRQQVREERHQRLLLASTVNGSVKVESGKNVADGVLKRQSVDYPRRDGNGEKKNWLELGFRYYAQDQKSQSSAYPLPRSSRNAQEDMPLAAYKQQLRETVSSTPSRDVRLDSRHGTQTKSYSPPREAMGMRLAQSDRSGNAPHKYGGLRSDAFAASFRHKHLDLSDVDFHPAKSKVMSYIRGTATPASTTAKNSRGREQTLTTYRKHLQTFEMRGSQTRKTRENVFAHSRSDSDDPGARIRNTARQQQQQQQYAEMSELAAMPSAARGSARISSHSLPAPRTRRPRPTRSTLLRESRLAEERRSSTAASSTSERILPHWYKNVVPRNYHRDVARADFSGEDSQYRPSAIRLPRSDLGQGDALVGRSSMMDLQTDDELYEIQETNRVGRDGLHRKAVDDSKQFDSAYAHEEDRAREGWKDNVDSTSWLVKVGRYDKPPSRRRNGGPTGSVSPSHSRSLYGSDPMHNANHAVHSPEPTRGSDIFKGYFEASTRHQHHTQQPQQQEQQERHAAGTNERLHEQNSPRMGETEPHPEAYAHHGTPARQLRQSARDADMWGVSPPTPEPSNHNGNHRETPRDATAVLPHSTSSLQDRAPASAISRLLSQMTLPSTKASRQDLFEGHATGIQEKPAGAEPTDIAGHTHREDVLQHDNPIWRGGYWNSRYAS